MNVPRMCRRMLRRGLALALILCAGGVAAEEPDWSDYAALLDAHVQPITRHGVTLNAVDYAALARDPRLASAVARVAGFPLKKLATAEERLAFLINAYNLYALKLVATHWPLDSIKDIGSFLNPVWKRTAGQLDGRDVSLDEIEHERLRTLGEPRIHLAIVCASISCPDLRTEPYRAATLAAQLDDQARQFLNNPGKGLRRDGDTVRISRIFDWFAEDFEATGGVAAFVRRYRADLPATEPDADLPYDWRVNAIP